MKFIILRYGFESHLNLKVWPLKTPTTSNWEKLLSVSSKGRIQVKN
jgi:hypothetical protein